MLKIFMVIALIPFLSGCPSVDGILYSDGLYGCVDLDGYFTDSTGRVIKLPEGTDITPELIESICP